MKKILLLFLLISSFSFGQTYIQVSTNSDTIYTYNNNPNQPNGTYNTTTSDSGLNTILQNYGITSITYNEHPVDNLRNLFFNYNGSDLAGLSNSLSNYNSLVTKVSVCPQYEVFGDVVITELVNANVGQVIGADANGIILTNDASLNTIYQNRNVTSAETYLLSGVYLLQCDCDVSELTQDLQNYTALINTTEYYNVTHQLSTTLFTDEQTLVYPNPVKDKIFIDSTNEIKELKIFNIQGKIIVNHTSVEQLNTQVESLAKGLYILEVKDIYDISFTTKLIKQ